MPDSDATLDQPRPLRAHLLGQVQLALGTEAIPTAAWSRRAERSLLLLLLATPGHRLTRDRILDALWPETQPDAARNALYKALHALRRVLEPDLQNGRSSLYIEAGTDWVGLRPLPGLWVDVDTFATIVVRLESASESERRELLREAVALYRGDLLADEPYTDWPVTRREEFRRTWERLVLDLAEREMEAGEPLAAVAPLEALLAADRTIEEAHRALMRAYAAAGHPDRAFRQYERCRQALHEQLGVEPDEATIELRAALQAAATAADRTAPTPVVVAPLGRFDKLPTPPTALIGRSQETEELQNLVWRPDVRLVTLTGPGGIGQTRLALDVAGGLAEDFAHGAAFVSLASVQNVDSVASAIAETLGVREEAERPLVETLHQELRPRELLLVLDNFEHLLGAAPLVADLVAACPNLKVLVTSREHLRLRGEHEYLVPPLTLPNPDRMPAPAALVRFESVALFRERVRGFKPKFEITDENGPILAEICVRLDGLPLAIELAAARLRFLSPKSLLTQLAHRLDVLAGGPRDLPARQQTLRNTISWSYDLLNPDEQSLLRRLAVFTGGATLEAAEWVMGDGSWVIGRSLSPIPHHPSPAVLDGLASLVNKSLLRWDENDGEPRVSMLETIREYALEQLELSGELHYVRRRHADHFLSLAARAAPELLGPQQGEWLDSLEAEHDNLRAALIWATEAGQSEIGLRLAGSLWRFWEIRGHLSEGRDWLERALALPTTTAIDARARAVQGLGRLVEGQGDYDRAGSLYEEALAMWERLEDWRGIAELLGDLANMAQDRGDYAVAAERHARALALWREGGDKRGIAAAVSGLGIVAYFEGRYDQAEALFLEGLTRMREIGDNRRLSTALNNLGVLAMQRGDGVQATAHHEEALALKRYLGDKQGIATSLTNLAETTQQQGDLERARPLYEAALAQFRELHDQRGTAITQGNLARLLHTQGDAAGALALFKECLATFHHLDLKGGIAECLEQFAALAAEQGDACRGARLVAAAATVWQAIGGARLRILEEDLQRYLAIIRAALDDTTFAAASAEGAALTLDQAVAEALSLTAPEPTMSPAVRRGATPP